MPTGCKYGTHRVIEPAGVMPQAAWRIDNAMEIRDNEILIRVQTLNIDAASFTQIKKEAEYDDARIGEIMLGIVAKRGKHHNPVTGRYAHRHGGAGGLRPGRQDRSRARR